MTNLYLQPLIDELHYGRRMQFIGGFLVFAFGVLGFGWANRYYQHDLSGFVQGIAMLVGLLGLYAMVHAWRMLHIKRHGLMQMLHHRPSDVVWVYSYVSVNMPYGVKLFRLSTIYVCDKFGEKESMMVRSSRLSGINKSLSSVFTWASHGYSVQKEQLYRANPEMLYQE